MSDSIDITRQETGSKGVYVARLDGALTAEMTYSRASDKLIIIDHTAVPDALRGKGVGKALVARVVEDARAEGFKIIPLCPFAKSVFGRTPEWRDVLN